MSQPSSIDVRDYYRRITSVELGGIARELLNGRITQSSERTLLCDCPNHHSQSKRSLNIMLDKQGWYCFGCGTGGDVLQLVEFVHAGCVTRGQTGRMPESHREARDFLAAKLGMPSLSHAGLSPEIIEEMERERRKSLRVFEALTALADYYHRRLLAHADALNWFREKYEIGDEMIARLKIGYAENAPWTDLAGNRQGGVLDELGKGPNAFTHAELSGTSAFRPSGSSITPFFNRRIVFPYWSRGHVVFMIGRKTSWTPHTDWETPKYKKLAVRNGEKHAYVAACLRNDVLYNEDILAARPDRIVITEGVTDCISLMEHGFPSISPVTVQIKDADWERILPKLVGVKMIYLCQDNELSDVGLQGALRTAQILIENGIATRVATLPLGENQQNARRRLKDGFGREGHTDSPRIGASGGTNKASEGSSGEDAALTASLLEEAKLDVNKYFAEGKTAADFEAVLASAQTPLELSISQLSAGTAESEIDDVLEPILGATKRLSPVEQERHLRLIQNRLGKERITLAALRKQVRATSIMAAKRTPRPNSPAMTGAEARRVPGGMLLPNIQATDRQLRDVSRDALGALLAFNNPPSLFIRGGKAVCITTEESGRQIIIEASDRIIRNRLTRAADFYEVTREGIRNCAPPMDVVKDILAMPPLEWDFPALQGIVEAPALREDGTLLVKPGYDPASRLFYAPVPDLCLPQIPDRPTADHIDVSVEMILNIIPDFPFVDEASRANAIASMLTPVCRPAIKGPTPLALFDATTQGTGKTLLSEVVSLIVTGREGSLFSAPRDAEEWRKQLTSMLREGSAVVVIDNVNYRLDSGDLCKALTATTHGDRILGHTQTINLPVRCSWIATGNNLQLGGDMPRRCYWVRMDAKCSKPFQRTGFRHRWLKRYVLTHRGELLAALLTLARAWFIAGRPQPDLTPVGSFEEWSTIVGGILQHAGVEGFLANSDQLYEQADIESVQWEVFLKTLDTVLYGESFMVSQVWECMNSKGLRLRCEANGADQSRRGTAGGFA